MPEYTVIYKKKGSSEKKGETDTVFAPSTHDAWTMARQILPKTAKIVDVVRSQDYSSNGRLS